MSIGMAVEAMDVPRVVTPSLEIQKKSDDQRLVNALVSAARLGNYQEVKALLEFTNVNGVSNMTDSYGQTALLAATQHHQLTICVLLIEHGADIHAAAIGGDTALHIAAQMGYEQICKLLLERGAYADFPNENLDVALKFAASLGYKVICRLLIEHGAALNSRNLLGITPLMAAASYNREKIVQLLLTVIPLVEEEKILRTRASLLASQTALLKVEPALQKDVRLLIARRYIAKPIIDQLIAQQMARVELMLAMRNHDGFSAFDIALGRADMFVLQRRKEALIRMLDWSIPESREMVRKKIRNNIMHLLFDERLPRSAAEEARGAEIVSKHEEMRTLENAINEMPEEELDEWIQTLYPEGLPRVFGRE